MDMVLPVATGEAEQAARRHLTPGSRPLSLPSGPMSARIAADPAVPSRSAAVPGSSAGTLLSVTEPGEPPPGSGEAPEEGRSALPAATVVLAVIARPGQESADLGAVLAAFRLRGAELAVLCLTRGEGSEVNSTCERLEIVRPWELQVAAGMLGVSSVTIADYPDGRLCYVPPASLTDHVRRAIRRTGADLLLVPDPAVAADPDIAAVARAACLAAQREALAVLARTLPGPGVRWPVQLGEHGPAVRMRQRRAIAAHASQRTYRPDGNSAADASGAGPDAGTGPDPLDGGELVRWLVPPVTDRPAG